MNRKLFILLFCFVTLNVSATTDDMLYTRPARLDTLDEEDYFAMRDTIKTARRNFAKDKPQQIDTRMYVVKDVFIPQHQTFDKKWYDHIYVGAGMGAEKIIPRYDGYTFRTLSTIDLYAGKQISKYSDVRLSITGGLGYQDNTEKYLVQGGVKADYMYSISTLLNGYNPARRMDVSLLIGLGAMYSKMGSVKGAIAPEGHIGVRLRCYTGPLGTINIEPYIGIASDKLDLSGTRNYHKYDLFYGAKVNYSCYLNNNLSKESRLKILQNRMSVDRMVDPNTLESWRTPWFVEYGVGFMSVKSSDETSSDKMGNEVGASVGRWLSPVMGFRISGASRMNQWISPSQDTNNTGYNSHYLYGRVDALLNPLGFLRHFSWKAPYGGYLTLGMGIGQLTKYMPNNQLLRTHSESYRLGLHLFGRLSEDLQLFAEPYYNINVYTIPYTNVNMHRMYKDKGFGVNLGLTMLIRSHRYRDLYEMDNTQNYTYKNVIGVRVGLAGGLPIIQNTAPVYDNMGTNWNIMAFAEYRFNHLSSARLQGELLNLNVGKLLNFQDYYTDASNYSTTPEISSGIAKINHKLVLGSLNYMINLTNLCSGRFLDRKVELDAFAGPAMGYMLKSKVDYSNIISSMHQAHTLIAPKIATEKMTMMGFDIGLQLRARVWNAFSIVVVPTAYLMNYKNEIPGLNTVHAGGLHFFHTINVGVMYKIGSLHWNPEKKRREQAHGSNMWRRKQVEKEHKWLLKQELKQAKRKSKYGY